MRDLAPIALFVYNRPEHTRRTIEALCANEWATESDLYIFSDGAKSGAFEEERKKIGQVREVIHSVTGFKSVHLRLSSENKGLANSIIVGATELVNQFGRVIVLEDDLITSRYFIRYMNDTLNFYRSDKRIFTVGAYGYPLPYPSTYPYDVYASYRNESWGWGTWVDRWSLCNWDIHTYDIICHPTASKIRKFNRGGVDLYDMLLHQCEGKSDSWAIRWQNCLYENEGFCISPKYSFVSNRGFDGSGTHCTVASGDLLSNAPMYEPEEYCITLKKDLTPNRVITKLYYNYYWELMNGPMVPQKTKLKRWVKRNIFHRD